MNLLSRICWVTAPIYVLVGMVFGIYMSASGDHTYAPAHAHLNLLGWVTIALFGTFYTLVPRAARGRLPKIQVALAHIAVITMFPGIILAISGTSEILAKVSSVIAILSMLLFLFIVIRSTGKEGAGGQGRAKGKNA